MYPSDFRSKILDFRLKNLKSAISDLGSEEITPHADIQEETNSDQSGDDKRPAITE
jgi:hypothetical protein